MTTNVLDRVAGVLSTDSRWSQQWGRWLVYVDDTAFHKIEVSHSTAFMFAGRGKTIQCWKDWIRDGGTENTLPDFAGLCVCAVDVKTKAVKICENLPIVREDSAFGGSGSRFAFTCWSTNKSAVRAVDTAKGFDPATGGRTAFLQVETGENNLEQTMFLERTLAEVDRAILSRGIVMDINATKVGGIPFKLKDLAASNDEVRELEAKIASGELSADAPSAGMHNTWTEEQKARVKTALKDIFGWQ
jgi:hypothetical protein